MGAWNSVLNDYAYEGSTPKSIGYSKKYKTSHWDVLEDKNYEYWFGEGRFTKISRRLYKEYTKGWVYGYYYENAKFIVDNTESDSDEEDICLEKEF